MAGVLTEIDVTLVVDPLENILHGLDMVTVCGADNVIWLHREHRPGLTKGCRNAVNILPRCLSCFVCGFGYLFTMLIGTGLKADIIAAETAKTAVSVSNNCGVGHVPGGA